MTETKTDTKPATTQPETAVTAADLLQADRAAQRRNAVRTGLRAGADNGRFGRF